MTAGATRRPKSISLSSYPAEDPTLTDKEAERQVELLREIIVALRNLRAEMGIPPKTQLEGICYGHRAEVADVVTQQAAALSRLANVKLTAQSGAASQGKAMHHGKDFDLQLELPAEETKTLRERLAKQLKPLEKARDSSQRQLGNEQFLSKAPPHVVESIRQKLADYESQIARIRETLSGLG